MEAATPALQLTSQDDPGKESKSLSRSFRNSEEVGVALAASRPPLPPSCGSSGPPRRLITWNRPVQRDRTLYLRDQMDRESSGSLRSLMGL